MILSEGDKKLGRQHETHMAVYYGLTHSSTSLSSFKVLGLGKYEQAFDTCDLNGTVFFLYLYREDDDRLLKLPG